MKKIVFYFALFFMSINSFAQAPQKISYQAVIRNASGNLLLNSAIGMRISILQGAINGSAVFVETHTSSTNSNGLLTIEIGGGIVVSGTLPSVNWANGPYFIKTETDPNGGSNYSIVGASELLSVPYALYAANAINYSAGNGISITSGSIVNTSPDQTVNIAAGNSMSVSGTYPNYTLTNTAPNQTVNITQGNNITVNGAYPNYTINTASAVSPTIVGIGMAAVTSSNGNSFTVTVPNPSLTISGSSLSISGGNTVTLPSATTWSLGGNAGTSTLTNFIGTTDANGLNFRTNNTLAIHISTAGNVGVGTFSPSVRFEVAPGLANAIASNEGNVSVYHGFNWGNALFAENNNTGNASGIIAYAQAMLAGINTNNPFGSVNTGAWGNVTGNGSSGYGVVASYGALGSATTYVGLAGSTYAGIFMGGDVGIGLTNPAFNLQVAANSAAKPTSNTWTIPSDARLKKDVHNYEAGLAEVLKIRPVWFTYTGEAAMPQETGVGIIAQELQLIAPYMVKEWTYTPASKNKQGNNNNQQAASETQTGVNYLGVDNGPMTYMLINAIKEQQQQIEDSKKQMAELKKQVEEQKKLIDLLLKK